MSNLQIICIPVPQAALSATAQSAITQIECHAAALVALSLEPLQSANLQVDAQAAAAALLTLTSASPDTLLECQAAAAAEISLYQAQSPFALDIVPMMRGERGESGASQWESVGNISINYNIDGTVSNLTKSDGAHTALTWANGVLASSHKTLGDRSLHKAFSYTDGLLSSVTIT